MPHVLRAGAIVFVYLGASYGLSGQTTDTRLDDAVKEIAQLKRMAADQERRIASLESTVRSQQRAILAAAGPFRRFLGEPLRGGPPSSWGCHAPRWWTFWENPNRRTS
jgi:hypothetical protein